MGNIKRKILVTGSEGVVGSSLIKRIESDYEICKFDLRIDKSLDILNKPVLEQYVKECVGIIHFAAVSRVIWGYHNPDLCWRTNVAGTQNVVESAIKQKNKPWILFAGSREVYGQKKILPVKENAELDPINVYGQSKMEGERIISNSYKEGVLSSIVRLSSVYGVPYDYCDRVVPAFVTKSLNNETISIEGKENTLDFTNIRDVVNGFSKIINILENGINLPPVHFVSGIPTTLEELATLSVRVSNSKSDIVFSSPRNYDVSKFYGDPEFTQNLVGWKSEIPIEEGVRILHKEYLSK